MRTIERNYKSNPHKASFLLAFHTAGAHNIDGQVTREVAPRDLLDEVPVEAPAYKPTTPQAELMARLMTEIMGLDQAAGLAAVDFTSKVNQNEAWTREEGHKYNPSVWIGRLIAKANELRAAAKTPVTELSPGRYGIVKDDEVKCYSVSYGKAGTRWDGYLFLNRISSDDEWPIRNKADQRLILAAIKADAEAARVLAALTLKKCSECGRQLSDTKNPYYPIGKGPDCGAK